MIIISYPFSKVKIFFLDFFVRFFNRLFISFDNAELEKT